MGIASDVAIGIHLGNSTVCVAISQDEHVDIISNELGNHTTPAYVAFADNEYLVGEAAQAKVIVDRTTVVVDIQHLFGLSYSEALEAVPRWHLSIVNKNDRPAIEMALPNDKTMAIYPEEILAVVLAKMKGLAVGRLGKSIDSALTATIAIPDHFTQAQRQAVMDASATAGLNVHRILNASTAAAIAYGWKSAHNPGGKRMVLVFHLGGTSCAATLLSVDDDGEDGVVSLEVLATNSDLYFGGLSFDGRLLHHCKQEYKRQNGGDVGGGSGGDDKSSLLLNHSPAARQLLAACERAKVALSSQPETTIQIESPVGGVDFKTTITRATFEAVSSDLIARTLEPIERCLCDVGLLKTNIDEIILVGGYTRIPKVRSTLSEFFGSKEISMSIPPDEVAAYGAAIRCLARH